MIFALFEIFLFSTFNLLLIALNGKNIISLWLSIIYWSFIACFRLSSTSWLNIDFLLINLILIIFRRSFDWGFLLNNFIFLFDFGLDVIHHILYILILIIQIWVITLFFIHFCHWFFFFYKYCLLRFNLSWSLLYLIEIFLIFTIRSANSW